MVEIPTWFFAYLMLNAEITAILALIYVSIKIIDFFNFINDVKEHIKSGH